MKQVRLRFTIGNLMIAVALVAGLLALFTAWIELLPVAILVGIPLVSLSGLLARVPPHRPGWRFGILLVILGLVILGGGWFWARAALWIFQRQERSFNLDGAAHANYYGFWGLDVPMLVTAVGLVVDVLVLVIVCARRRRAGLVLLVVGYAFALAFTWLSLFALLALEAFD
jgi:hypothetical protein